VNTVLADNGVGAINFGENTWHFYPKWEHLLAGSTLTRSGWPFLEPGGRRRVVYDKDTLPVSAELMARTLVYQIPIKMAEERLAKIRTALKKAAAI